MTSETPRTAPSLSLSSSPLLSTFQRVTSPFLELLVVSKTTIGKYIPWTTRAEPIIPDTMIKLCAGIDAVARIERARKTQSIEKSSKAFDPEHVEDVDCRLAGSNNGAFLGLDSATGEAQPGVIHRCTNESPPISPSFVYLSGSGPLHGLLFTNTSPSRSPSKTSLQSDSDTSLENFINGQLAGRTNLANCFKSFRPEADLHTVPSRQGAFVSDPKTSQIAAQIAYQRQESDNEGGDWEDEIAIPKNEENLTRYRPSVRSGETRTGRRAVRFFDIRASKQKERPDRDIEEVDERATVDDDCAIESCDNEECDLQMIEQQKQRKRYHG